MQFAYNDLSFHYRATSTQTAPASSSCLILPCCRCMCAVKCEKFHFNWITSFILANRRRHARRHSEGQELGRKIMKQPGKCFRSPTSPSTALQMHFRRASNATPRTKRRPTKKTNENVCPAHMDIGQVALAATRHWIRDRG